MEPVQVDGRVEDALRAAVRHSLGELLRGLVGDRRSEAHPLLSTALFLERNGRVEMRPAVQVGVGPQGGAASL